jgi:hypothetical protein
MTISELATRIDLNATAPFLGVLVAFLGVLVALITLLFQTRRSRLALATESILSLTERVDSSWLRHLRRTAAGRLINHEEENRELSEVLDFFNTIAVLVDSKALNENLAFREFSWWMIRYWVCAKEYVVAERKTYPGAWKSLERVVTRFAMLERDWDNPLNDHLQEFLQSEAQLAQC